jgi:hypothetical protein
VRHFLLTPLVLLCSAAVVAQSPAPPPATDLDALMARALQRREIDRKTLGDYVLDEVEGFEILGPGGAPLDRFKREYTWFVKDGMHVRSPVKADGVPIAEADRRAYEARWIRSEESRRKHRTERDEQRAKEGKPPAFSVPPVNEPRFVSESYFMDFKFEPGNYYLAGKEQLAGREVLRIDYFPTHLFDRDEKDDATNASKDSREQKQRSKEIRVENDITHKMNKTARVTLWVDPDTQQIVKYTFDNVWLDFLPGKWLVRIDDLHASMEMHQPFPGVWLPKGIEIHAAITLADGTFQATYTRRFSNYRRADVTTRITIPKEVGR